MLIRFTLLAEKLPAQCLKGSGSTQILATQVFPRVIVWLGDHDFGVWLCKGFSFFFSLLFLNSDNTWTRKHYDWDLCRKCWQYHAAWVLYISKLLLLTHLFFSFFSSPLLLPKNPKVELGIWNHGICNDWRGPGSCQKGRYPPCVRWPVHNRHSDLLRPCLNGDNKWGKCVFGGGEDMVAAKVDQLPADKPGASDVGVENG